MSQQTQSRDSEEFEQIKDDLESVKGYESRDLDVADDDHDLDGLDSKRQAPIEHVAENVVNRYDEKQAFIREYTGNAHTACVQAARHELREAGLEDRVDMENVEDVLDTARELIGYEPIIEIEYNRDPSANWTFRVADNGIGIPKEKAPAIRDIGLSGWNDDGTTNGQFGQGTMSGFLPTTPYGEFHMFSNARTSDDNYRVAWKLTDINKLNGTREQFGTTFEWPVFTDEAEREIDVKDAVEEYVEGMIVPALYTEYDETGTECDHEEYLPLSIEERYPDDAVTIDYEDQFGRIVWSPSSPKGYGSSAKTWSGYQPINRNDGRYGTSNNPYNAPSKFDIRIKVENGAIVAVDGDMSHELVGKVPISEKRYERLDDGRKDGYVTFGDVPNDGVVRAPEPTDDRDRLESGQIEAYMRRYSKKIEEKIRARAGSIIESIDSFEEIGEIDSNDRELLLRAVDEYVDVYKKNDADRLADDIGEAFDIDVGPDFARKIGETTSSVLHVPEGTSRPGRKRHADSKPVWEVVEEAGSDGTVYMGQSISTWKAKVVWDLHEDNQLVRVSTSEYGKWQRVFGWELVKDLPGKRGLEKHLGDELSDDILDKYAKTSSKSVMADSDDDQLTLDGMDFDEYRAKRRRVKVRTASGMGNFREMSGEDLFEKADRSDGFKYKNYSVDDLIVYDQTEHGTSVGENIADREKKGVVYTVVPKYVRKYLLQAENAVTEDEYVEQELSKTVEFDWTAKSWRQSDEIQNMDENDVFVCMSDSWVETFREEGLVDELAVAVAESLDDVTAIDSMTFERPTDDHYEVMHEYENLIEMDEEPSVVSVDLTTNGGRADASVDGKEMYFDAKLPSLDRSVPEWSYFRPDVGDDDCIEILSEIEDAGGFASTDDDVTLPDTPDCVGYSATDESDQWYTLTMQRLQDHRRGGGD